MFGHIELIAIILVYVGALFAIAQLAERAAGFDLGRGVHVQDAYPDCPGNYYVRARAGR